MSKQDYQPPRGFRDLLPPASGELSRLEDLSRQTFRLHGFEEVRVPAVEDLGVFVKSSGETSDVVQKEMFLVGSHVEGSTEGGERQTGAMALRPEGTPGVVRAYLNAGLAQTRPNQRLFYVGSMFRHERPQKGRFREFVQIGAEWLGAASPASDAELIQLVFDILERAGLPASAVKLVINTLGDGDCRPAYKKELLAFFAAVRGSLCADCQKRIDRNPMRVFDCKTDGERVRREAPRLKPCAPCGEHFASVKSLLAAGGVAFEEDPFLVRGLDYYTRTVFEVKFPGLGAQDTITAGGRYDGLIALVGGPATPASGWAMGAERVLMALEALQAGKSDGQGAKDAVYLALPQASAFGFQVARNLRRKGVRVISSAAERNERWQQKEAERLNAKAVLTIGADEAAKRSIRIDGKSYSEPELMEYLEKLLK